MNASEFETRLRSSLSDLSQNLTDEQIADAIASALEVTGITLPTADPEKVEALLNRGQAFCLETLQNDWLQRFDMKYGEDNLSRADVAKAIEQKLARLQSRWEQLSRKYQPDADRASRGVAIATARRV